MFCFFSISSNPTSRFERGTNIEEQCISGSRKRRMTKMEIFERDKLKLKNLRFKQKIKHPLIKISCTGKCYNRCTLLSDEHQNVIWSQFWQMDYTHCRKFISQCISILPIKRW